PVSPETSSLSLHDALPIFRGFQLDLGGEGSADDDLAASKVDVAPPKRHELAAAKTCVCGYANHFGVLGILACPSVDLRLAQCRRSEEHTSELQSPYDLVCR